MNNVPYGPDRSLLLAIGILVGGLTVCAGGIYLLSVVGTHAVQGGGVKVVPEPQTSSRLSDGAVRSVRSPHRSAAPRGSGGVPTWAQPEPHTGRSLARRSPSTAYMVTPDFGYAELGSAPDVSVGGGAPGAVGEGGQLGTMRPEGGDLRAEFGRDATRNSEGQRSGWRAAASTLNGRLRALEGALARRDRGVGGGQAQGQAATQERGKVSAASAGPGPSAASGPGTPDAPNQVPLGGAEWLAAAGAAYAVNRLRRNQEGEDDSGDEA